MVVFDYDEAMRDMKLKYAKVMWIRNSQQSFASKASNDTWEEFGILWNQNHPSGKIDLES